MVARALSRLRIPTFASILLRDLTRCPIHEPSPSPFLIPQIPAPDFDPQKFSPGFRHFRDGRPKEHLWRGKKLIEKEALFVILGLKRFKDDEERLDKFIKTHVLRLLKTDMLAVLTELERQREVDLSLKMFAVMRKQEWYQPDVYLYKDLIITLARCNRMDYVMQLWKSMKNDGLFPDSQTYTEIIEGFLRDGFPADAMKIYEDMKKSPYRLEELPFRILLKGLAPHPSLRSRVMQDFLELFPDLNVKDPPEEIFGVH